ncbi:MAG: hypothetical protein HY826_01135 [Actinobacteria bacterium]|nr:hypothetical protein [Actinomycetota bacterium]
MTVTGKRWAAIGAAVAVAIGGGALALVSAADGGTPSSFVPITPCRLLDTRSTSPVGPRSTPITAGESLSVQVTGSNGSCVIPSSATAIVINVTAVGPTAASFITLFPADVSLPNASNLNFTAGQSPAPNLVTVSLSAGGAIKIFNESGNVNVIGDIAGYYQPDNGTGNAGAACSINGLSGVIVNGFDYDNNVSSKCFTSLVTTLAGSTGGFSDTAPFQFDDPTGVAVDGVGNIYVADRLNNRIRKITPTGIVSTLAGQTAAGSANLTGALASFNFPEGVAVDNKGNVYVADTANFLIRKITPLGLVSTLAGSTLSAGFQDATGTSALFASPRGLAVDTAGNVYVADQNNNRIRKITPAGVVTTLAGQTASGSADGTGAAAQFTDPRGVAVDSAGNVYVADAGNNLIRKVTAAGVVTTLAGSTAGFLDGTGAGAQFNAPFGVAVDASGNVYVTDQGNARIRKVTAAGVVTTLAGTSPASYADGVGTDARFSNPRGIAIDTSGTIYIGDVTNDRVRRIN